MSKESDACLRHLFDVLCANLSGGERLEIALGNFHRSLKIAREAHAMVPDLGIFRAQSSAAFSRAFHQCLTLAGKGELLGLAVFEIVARPLNPKHSERAIALAPELPVARAGALGAGSALAP
jgi:hypothetical protein